MTMLDLILAVAVVAAACFVAATGDE